MVDHRYLSEMSKALHIFLGFSFLSCAVISFIRLVTANQMKQALAKAPGVQPRSQKRSGLVGYVYGPRR